MTYQVAETRVHVQRLVSVVKMTTLLEGVLRKSSVQLRVFMGERFTEKYIHKEMFPVYGGKLLSRKAVHNRVVNISLMTKRLKGRFGCC
jgi:hypothetical protein